MNLAGDLPSKPENDGGSQKISLAVDETLPHRGQPGHDLAKKRVAPGPKVDGSEKNLNGWPLNGDFPFSVWGFDCPGVFVGDQVSTPPGPPPLWMGGGFKIKN